MQITVDIPDDSEELQELLDCVAEVNRTTPPAQHITIDEYARNIVMGWLTNRVLDIFVRHARKQTPAVLRGKFGPAKNIRN